jgi:hypothetical protein
MIKKTILLLAVIAIAQVSAKDYKLSEERFLEKNIIGSSIIVDWCVGTQVWREFKRGRRGGFSQILIINKAYRTVPLTCDKYEEYKDII